MTKPKICWIADVPGWAYDNRCRAVSALLPSYDHRIVYDVVRHPADALLAVSESDITVCPDPRILPFVAARGKVVLNLNAVKIF